jgi:uncharacterized membrane protein
VRSAARAGVEGLGHLGVSARRKVAVSAVGGLVAGGSTLSVLPWPFCVLIAWDIAAVIFLAWTWRTIWPMDPERTARDAEREDPTRAAADLVLLIAAVVSLVAVGYVIVRAGSAGGFAAGVQVGLGVASVIASWAVVHTIYTLRYARLYYSSRRDGGVDFHQDDAPRFSDFAYMAFTVGMTFQVSDTEINTPVFRAYILRHALLSYLFGTVIVALTINLVAGLSK